MHHKYIKNFKSLNFWIDGRPVYSFVQTSDFIIYFIPRWDELQEKLIKSYPIVILESLKIST